MPTVSPHLRMTNLPSVWMKLCSHKLSSRECVSSTEREVTVLSELYYQNFIESWDLRSRILPFSLFLCILDGNAQTAKLELQCRSNITAVATQDNICFDFWRFATLSPQHLLCDFIRRFQSLAKRCIEWQWKILLHLDSSCLSFIK